MEEGSDLKYVLKGPSGEDNREHQCLRNTALDGIFIKEIIYLWWNYLNLKEFDIYITASTRKLPQWDEVKVVAELVSDGRAWGKLIGFS